MMSEDYIQIYKCIHFASQIFDACDPLYNSDVSFSAIVQNFRTGTETSPGTFQCKRTFTSFILSSPP